MSPPPSPWKRIKTNSPFCLPPAPPRLPKGRASPHPSSRPMARESGAASQLSGCSGGGWFRPTQAAGRRPSRRRGSSLFFAVGRAWPSPAEHSRAQPSPAEPRARTAATAAAARAPPSKQASERAAAAAEEAPPQGEEVPAHRRPPAAEAAPVAPRRERPRGRVGGGDIARVRLPRPPPAGFRASVGAQHLAALDPPAGVHRAQLR